MRCLQRLAFALGGEAGARLLPHLKMRASAATLLQIMRHTQVVNLLPDRDTTTLANWLKQKGFNGGHTRVRSTT